MTVIVSDASPLHYLALIGEAHILPVLYGRVVIPQKIFDELQQPATPAVVKTNFRATDALYQCFIDLYEQSHTS